MTINDKLSLIDRNHQNISLSRQAELLDISHSRLHYQSKINEKDLYIMNLIGAIYTKYPYYGKEGYEPPWIN